MFQNELAVLFFGFFFQLGSVRPSHISSIFVSQELSACFWSLWIEKTQLLVGWLKCVWFLLKSTDREHLSAPDRRRGCERERGGGEKKGEVDWGNESWRLHEQQRDILCSVLPFHPWRAAPYELPLWAAEAGRETGEGGRRSCLKRPGNGVEKKGERQRKSGRLKSKGERFWTWKRKTTSLLICV